MPFEPKRGTDFEFRIVALAKFYTYDEIAKMCGVTRNVISGVIHRSKPGNREREKLRMRKRREKIRNG